MLSVNQGLPKALWPRAPQKSPASISGQATLDAAAASPVREIRPSFFPASAKISSAWVICSSSCAAETETLSSDNEFGVAGGIAMLV